MSRSGRPSARGVHKRNLMGPDEFLRQIKAAGGIPLSGGSTTDDPSNARVEQAETAAVEAIEAARERIAEKGIDVETPPAWTNPGDDPTVVDRREAWTLSVLQAMKESVPRRNWCRHMRAADPNVIEIRTLANLSAGVWLCFECMQQADKEALNANPWPDECDLCGATMTRGHFNEMAFNLGG